MGGTQPAGGNGPTILSVDYVNIGGATWVAVAYSDGTYVNTLVDNKTGEVLKTETGETQNNEEPETVEVDSNDNDSSGETESSDDADVDTSDVDEYTPGRDGEYIMPLAHTRKRGGASTGKSRTDQYHNTPLAVGMGLGCSPPFPNRAPDW